MAVALGDARGAVERGGAGARREVAGVGAQAHGTAQAADGLLLFHEGDDGVRGPGGELGAVGVGPAQDVAGEGDDGALHPQADAQEGRARGAGVGDGAEHPQQAAPPETARDEDGVGAGQARGGVAGLERLGFHAQDLELGAVGQGGVGEGLVDALVSVLVADVLAHDGDGDGARGAERAGQPGAVVAQIQRPRLQAQGAEGLHVKPLLREFDGHLVDGVADVELLDDAAPGDVAEGGELAQVLGLQAALGAADQEVGLDADVAQDADGLLRGLGLELLGGLEVRDVGQVDEGDVAGLGGHPELPRGLEEGKALDVAGGAADLGDGDVHVRPMEGAHGALDLVGDVGDDLDGRAQVAALALAGDHRAVDFAAGVVGGLGAGDAGDALVVAQVKVGLRAVVGDEDLAVLVGAHRAGVDVEVRVQLLHGHAVAAPAQEEGERGGGDALAEAADDAAGDEEVLGAHWRASMRETKVRKRDWASRGPGAASGWNCTDSAGSARWRTPSHVPSLRFTWVCSRQSGRAVRA